MTYSHDQYVRQCMRVRVNLCVYVSLTLLFLVGAASNTTLQDDVTHRNTPQHTATHGNILQHTTTYCNRLQHTCHCGICIMSKGIVCMSKPAFEMRQGIMFGANVSANESTTRARGTSAFAYLPTHAVFPLSSISKARSSKRVGLSVCTETLQKRR